jgi:hypothetical protein
MLGTVKKRYEFTHSRAGAKVYGKNKEMAIVEERKINF